MGEKSTWRKIFPVGESVVMTGIAHFFHFLAPHRLQFRFTFFHLGRRAQSSNRYGHAAARMRSMSGAAAKAGLSNLIAWAYSCTLPCCGSAELRRTLHAIAAVLVSASCPCAFPGAQIAFQLKRCACSLQRLTQR